MLVIVVVGLFSYNKFFEKNPQEEKTQQTASEITSLKETEVSNLVNRETGNVLVEYYGGQVENNNIEVIYMEDGQTTEFSDQSEEVKAIVEKYMKEQNLTENNFAFFYYNLSNKEYYFYNENTFFTAASTIKVPIAMIYYEKIKNGELTLDTTLQYKATHYEAGAGATSSRYKPGNNVPISFLLEQMIVNSDNTATQILKSGLGGETEYRKLIANFTNRELADNFYNENITSAGYGFDVIKNLYDNRDKYQELIEYMKKSSNGGYLKKNIKDVEIAHKYGSYDRNIHDYGIVYAENPYIIGIFTDGITNAEECIANINEEIL